MRRVFITGVRGKTGVPLARLLTAHDDVEVLGGSSDPSFVDLAGVRPAAFSWDDPDGWPAAVEGVDAVYVVRPDREDAPRLMTDLLRTTAAHTRVVLLSEQDADSFAPGTWALEVERAVRESGRSWTILRPGWFAQVFTDDRYLRGDVAAGRLRFPAGGAALAWIDTRDIAAVAERALLDDGFIGTVHELSGPQALTLPETTAVLSEVLGRPIEHEEVSIEDAVIGVDGFDRWEFVTTYERVRAGVYAVTDGVERATGRPARSFRDFLTEHRDGLGARPVEEAVR
ncbi:MAG: NAD(P)H-binding protein [Actinomycetia bacterium]|nr:NAD(P)H-binding protein [Actinomycetes bacterium]